MFQRRFPDSYLRTLRAFEHRRTFNSGIELDLYFREADIRLANRDCSFRFGNRGTTTSAVSHNDARRYWFQLYEARLFRLLIRERVFRDFVSSNTLLEKRRTLRGLDITNPRHRVHRF